MLQLKTSRQIRISRDDLMDIIKGHLAVLGLGRGVCTIVPEIKEDRLQSITVHFETELLPIQLLEEVTIVPEKRD